MVAKSDITVTLSKALQEDFESWLECCQSLQVTPKINSFLHYVANYGTSKDGSHSIQSKES